MKKIFVVFICVLLLAGQTAQAAPLSSPSPSLLAAISEEIKVLLERIKNLQAELNSIQKKETSSSQKPQISQTGNLSRGARGEEIRELQKFLSADPSIYPSKSVSGYFGPLTERALKKFQTRYGIKPTGILDQETQAKISELKSSSAATNELPPSQKSKTKNPAPATQTKQSTNNLKAIEEELSGVKQGTYLGPEHAERIYKDLSALEAKGHPKDKIESLKKKVFELSPHLQDKIKKENEALHRPVRDEAANKSQAQDCVDKPPILTADITDFSKIKKITAPGSPTNDRDLYKGHSFIWTDSALVPVYSPVDATLTSGKLYEEFGRGNYILNFEIPRSCGYTFRFDHLHTVSDTIKNALERGETVNLNIRAGEKVGETTGNAKSGNWDFGMYNEKKDGPLAALNAFGLGAKAICWVDYFILEKQKEYRRLLEGNELVCSFNQ